MTKHQTCRECHYDFVGPDANIGGNLCETCSQEFHSECREQLAEAEETVKALRTDQQDWRKGVELIASALDMSTLSCVDISERVLKLQIDAQRYAYIRDCLAQSHSLHMDGTKGFRLRSVYGRASSFDKLVDAKLLEAFAATGYTPTGASTDSEN